MKISIISVEYNDLNSLFNLINSIKKNILNIEYEIIIISNSYYNKEKQENIKKYFKKIKFKFNNKNLGYAKAVNQGLRLATGEYILVINPDVVILDNNLLLALSFLENNNKICMVGPRIIDDSSEIQDSYRVFVTPKTLFLRSIKREINKILYKKKYSLLEYNQYFSPHPVDWISGACMLIKKAAIEKVGPMDERFFMYCEDMDWCRRFWQHHYEVWSFPHWTVQHNATRASTSRVFALNKLKIIHIISMLKYFWKWKFYINKY